MYTDDELAEKQRIFLLDNPHQIYAVGEREHRARFAELYRLARLGLAAEQVGQWNFQEAVYLTDGDVKVLEPFLNHEAWRK